MITFLRRRAAPVLVLTIGYSVLHAIVMFWVISIMGGLTASNALREYPRLTIEGEPIVNQYRGAKVTFRDLKGNAIDSDRTSNRNYEGHWLPSVVPYRGDNLDHQMESFSDLSTPETYWYLRIKPINGQMRAYLEGYDQGSRRRIGYLHADGFTKTPPSTGQQFQLPWTSRPMYAIAISQSDHFSLSSPHEPRQAAPAFVLSLNELPASSLLFATPEGVFEVDMKNRLVSQRFPVKDLNWLGIETMFVEGSERNCLLGRGGNEVFFWSDLKATPLTMTIPTDLGPQHHLLIQREKDSSFIVQSFETFDFWSGVNKSGFYWTDKVGKITRTESFQYQAAHEKSRFGWNLAVPTLAPSLVAFPVGAAFLSFEFHNLFPHLWPGFLVTAMIGLACARTCYRNERRCQSPSTWFWTIFVGLFGLPGLFGYWCSRDWPDVAVSPWLKGTPPQPVPPLGNEIFGDEETTPSVAVMA